MMRQRAKNRKGYAMLIVIAIVLSSTALATIQMRHLDSALRIERARMDAQAYSAGSLSVVAIAIERLETGDPSTFFDYGYSHTVGGNQNWYRIDYDNTVDQWTVNATPDPTAAKLWRLPSSF